MKKWSIAGLVVLGAALLGATVLREPIAAAAQSVSANITGPLDGQGNVKVHEQGAANVNVTNSPTVRLDPTSAVAPISTRVLFEQAIGDSAPHEFDASSADSIRLIAGGCPSGSSFQIELDTPTLGGLFPLDRIGVSCSDPVVKIYDRVLSVKLDAVVSNRQNADGSAATFPVDVTVYGRP
jgi:hypothetical protein